VPGGPDRLPLPQGWGKVEAADDGLVTVDADGVVVAWDDATQAVFGWSSHEALGRTLADIIGAPAAVADALADLARSQPEATGPLVRRRVCLAARHRDGHSLPVEMTAWAQGDKPLVMALVRDLTAPLQAEAAMSRLAAIVTSSPDAIISEDLCGAITSWNDGAQQLFGWAAAEVIGKHASLLVPANLADEAARLTERVRRGQAEKNYETRRLPKHGQPLDVALTISPVRDDASRVTAVATIARDITEQRWLAGALDESIRQLQAALEAAESAEERVRTFMENAAHQLRGPITGVHMSAESLLADPWQPDRQRLLANMVRGAARAGQMIASLLRAARLDQGEHVISPAPCDILGICTDEVDRLYSLAPNLDIVLRADHVDDARPAVDAETVREILANLLDNARRYAVQRIWVTITVQNAIVEIRVADDGPGLPNDLLERAFERFVTVGDHAGSGLGLPIARGLARAHGGDLFYADGAFVLRLPVNADEAAAAAR